MRNRNIIRDGFTLIELLVVIAIVAIISAVAIPIYKEYATRSKVSKAFSVMSGYLELSKGYYALNGTFPNASELGLSVSSTSYDIANPSTIIDGANRIILNKFCNGQKGEVSVRFSPTLMSDLTENLFMSMVVGESDDGLMVTECFYRSQQTGTSSVRYVPANCSVGYPDSNLTTTLCETPIAPPA